MSLNGLEAPEVIEAYQTALNEGGGWFLLKYNTRDEVSLLERGKGGVGEIQEAINGYEEESPLYGFIHYRRRKVVLKYVPEGTSRLLLARLAVHFESIKETFTPYDTIFTFAEAYELSDSTLSSTCSLHTAASVKSLRSSPTQNLAGVKEEDVSESGTVRGPGSEAGTIRNSKVEAGVNDDVRAIEDISLPHLHDEIVAHSSTNGTSNRSKTSERVFSTTTQRLRPRTASDTDKDLPPTPDFSSPYLSENPESIYDRGEFGPRSSIDTRISSNSARPSTRDLNRAYDYNRPKVKVGPRPSIDSAMRPDTAYGNDHDVRPVASLPSGVRMSARKAVPPRPNSQQSQKRFPLQIPQIPSQGSTPAPPPVTPTNATHPHDKRLLGLNDGLSSPVKNSDVKSPKMTPEKRRLMKALQIRQKHLAAQNAANGLRNDKVHETQEEIKKEHELLSSTITEAPSANGSQDFHSREPEPQGLNTEMPQPEDRETAKETSHEVQDSPISVPEPSDGPSTQASSITEEEISMMYKLDASEAKTIDDGLQNKPGLKDIIREQTQGPIVTIDSNTYEPREEVVERPTSVTFARQGKVSALPSVVRQSQPNLAIEGENVRDSVKTTSMSSTSSEHTMTDKKIQMPIDTIMSTEDVPRQVAAETPSHGSNPIETPMHVPFPVVQSETSKQTPEEVSVPDAEEPESPFLIEGHSVQTSASPSVVNLLDGLAATTHNESTITARDIEAIEPIQTQQPSLFNMIGGFRGSGESLEAPLSAVREEAEIAPSPVQSKHQDLDIEDPNQKTQKPLETSARDHGQFGELSQFPRVEDEPWTTEKLQTTDVKGPDQVVESSLAEAIAGQKNRPRTTSKTFQFSSKPRSLNSNEKPSSLDLSGDIENMQGSSDTRSTHIPHEPDTNLQSDVEPRKEQKIQPSLQPEGQSVEQSTTQPAQLTSVKPEKQPGSQSAGMPVPEALSHASSKALKVLGFLADQSELQPNVRTKQVIEPQASTGAAAQAYRKSQGEAVTDIKPDTRIYAESQRQQVLPEGQLQEFLDIHPDAPSETQTQQSKAGSFTSSLDKAIEQDKRTDRQARRRDIVEPVKRASTPDPSDEHFLSDDSFMEELKTATVQEAKPISVSRSPIKPGFLGSENDPRFSERRDFRVVSNPIDSGNRGERSASSTRPSAAVSLRSFSGTILPRPEVKTPPGPQSAQPKKFGVSSGISQRIKALEVKSSRPNSPSQPTPAVPGFLNLRRPSFNSELNGALTKSRGSTAYPSPQTSPETGRSDPLNRSATLRGETVSVTATIVRDPVEKLPWAPLDAANPPTVNLHESPLIVEHQVIGPNKQQVMGPPQFSPLKPPRPRYSRYSSARSASSSSTERKADGISHSRRGSSASKRSGRSSRNGSEVDLPYALSDRSLNSSSHLDGIKEEKKGSRSSRLLKRMSSITSISRRSIAQTLSPSPKEGSIVEREEPIAETPAFSAVDLGDINIQFPDSLLWKRRHMVVNESGILELSASKADNNSKVVTKRYPLSDFRPPYVPDQDRQELPNSIILDFNDGSSLQCACEHPNAQARLLNILKSAYSEHKPN